MSEKWTVKDQYVPRAKPNGIDPAVVNGQTFDFLYGDRLDIDESKTFVQEKDGVLICQWLLLSKGQFSGFVPYRPDDPDDFRSVAIKLDINVPEPESIDFFLPEVPIQVFAAGCVRKAIRWNTNAAYLFALAFVESGKQWPTNSVSSPPALNGQLGLGTFKFRPSTWRTLVEKIGKEEFISAGDAVYPQPQATFSAHQSGEFAKQFEKDLGDLHPTYIDLYLAHMFTYEGAKKIITASTNNGNQSAVDLIKEIFESLALENDKEILSDLFARKQKLIGTEAAPNTVAQLLIECGKEINSGFEKVRKVANSLIQSANISANDKSGQHTAGPDTLGVLSEEFESRGNPAAIGKDKTGGYSYGKYQIASKKSFKSFMSYLESEFADIFNVLVVAGGAKGALDGTTKFKTAWRQLVSSPDFVPAQHGFIKKTHYDVMVGKLKTTLDVENQSNAVKNVVWSTAVQHGPYSSIVRKVVTNSNKANPAKLINAVYDERSKVDIYFRSSTAKVKNSVVNRFKKERQMALNMLKQEQNG